MGRIALTVVLAMGLASFVGWSMGLFASGPGDDGVQNVAAPQPVAASSTLGDWIFQPVKDQAPVKPHLVPRGYEEIVLGGNLQEIDKIDIPSQVAGAILYIGDGLPEGTTQLAGIAPFMTDHYKLAEIQGGREISKFYRPLGKENEVVFGQMVAEIDYSKAINLFLAHKSLVERAKAELEMTQQMNVAARDLLNMTVKIGQASSTREYIEAKLTHVKTTVDIVKSEKELEKELIELDNARNLLAFHELRFKLPTVRRGYIKTIYHDTGEAVKENEPVLQIYSTDRLRAEALVESQYASRLKKNMVATLEPASDEMPLRMFEGHRANAAITGVGFLTAGKDLIVVSAGEDGFLKLWRQHKKGALTSVNHREPVKALACTPSGAGQPLCATGTGEGKIHLCNFVTDDNSEPRLTAALEQPLDGHRDSVTALAFSPDGKLLASGAADGSIKLWQADGTHIYAFDAAHGVDSPHQGAITSLSFTPQCRLVSASRDNTLRVWNLKAKGAHLEGTPITGRSGTVHQLGVSQDGRYMFFDQGKSLQLMTVPDGETINSLKNPGGSTPFETVAIFSQDKDASLVLTGGAPDGKLQLWRAPTEAHRGFEVRQMITEQRSPVTCAAFSPPVGSTGESAFAASGTKDGFVYLWPILSKHEADNHRIANVPVTLFSQGTDAGSRQYRIGVEVPNPDGPAGAAFPPAGP